MGTGRWTDLDPSFHDRHPHGLLVHVDCFGNLRQGGAGLVEAGSIAHLLCRQWLTPDDKLVGAEDADDRGLGDVIVLRQDCRRLTRRVPSDHLRAGFVVQPLPLAARSRNSARGLSVVRQGVRTCRTRAVVRTPDPAQILGFYPCWVFSGREVNKGDEKSLDENCFSSRLFCFSASEGWSLLVRSSPGVSQLDANPASRQGSFGRNQNDRPDLAPKQNRQSGIAEWWGPAARPVRHVADSLVPAGAGRFALPRLQTGAPKPTQIWEQWFD